MGLPEEVYEAYEKIIGAWTNAEETVFFMFTNPEINWNVRNMTFKINSIRGSVDYILTPFFQEKNSFVLHPGITTKPFGNSLVIEFIGDDILEVRYLLDEYIYTLMRTSDVKDAFDN